MTDRWTASKAAALAAAAVFCVGTCAALDAHAQIVAKFKRLDEMRPGPEIHQVTRIDRVLPQCHEDPDDGDEACSRPEEYVLLIRVEDPPSGWRDGETDELIASWCPKDDHWLRIRHHAVLLFDVAHAATVTNHRHRVFIAPELSDDGWCEVTDLMAWDEK